MPPLRWLKAPAVIVWGAFPGSVTTVSGEGRRKKVSSEIKPLDGSHQVVLAPQIEGVVDPDPPDARGGLYKAHDNKLASGAGLRHLIVQINHCIFQDKGNALLGEGIVWDAADLPLLWGRGSRWRTVRFLGPQLQGEAVSPSATRSSASSNSSSVPMVPKKWWLYPVSLPAAVTVIMPGKLLMVSRY